jgi:hypothetical protein
MVLVKNLKKHIRTGGLFRISVMILFLTRVQMLIFYWLSIYGYILDSQVVLSSTDAQRAHMDFVCSRLETVTRDIYNHDGWRLSKKIQNA